MENEIKQVEFMETTESEKGASMLEYALLAALIAVVCIAAITLLGQNASKTFSSVGAAMDT
ncbi:MAG: Flp family type IVb pilin [Bdellovibrionales bacterium]|nr:Flp family type IVb pilin [Bdellovibrionales bacterium]